MIQPRTASIEDGVADIPADEADEPLLLQRLAQGNGTAFWDIWMRYREDLFSDCLRWMGGNQEEAEDALSSASLKAFQCLPAYAQDIVNVKAWLVRLLRNHCMDIRRTRKRHDDVMQKMSTLTSPRPAWQPLECESPENVVSREEFFQDVRQAIDDLPPGLHDTVVLRLVRDLPYGEIAMQLHLSPEVARKRAQQGRAILRMSLAGTRPGHHDCEGGIRQRQAHGHAKQIAMSIPSHERQEIIRRSTVMGALQVQLATGAECHLYYPIDHKPIRQQQKLTTLRRYVQRHPGGWKKRLELGHLLYAMGQWEEAIRTYKQVLQKQPRCFETWLRLGESYHVLARMEETMDAYEKALSWARQAATQHHVQGLIAACEGASAEAVQAFQRATTCDPDHASHWHALGTMHLYTACPDEALDAFDQALQRNPNDLVALTHSYDALHAMGRHTEACRRVARVLQIDTNNALALKRMADTQSRTQQAQSATGKPTRALLKHALYVAPNAPDVHAALARYHIVRGESARGVAILQQFTQQHPRSPAGWYYAAQGYFHFGNIQAATHAVRQAYRLIHDRPVAGFSRSEPCFQPWRQATLMPCVGTMLQHFPSHWSTWLPAGQVLVPNPYDSDLL